MANVFFNLGAPAGNGVGVGVDVSSLGREKTIAVEGTFGGVVIIEFSNEAIGGPYAQLTQFVAGNRRTIAVAARFMRVRRAGVPVVNPGLPNVDVGSNDNGALFTDLPASASNGTGASVDVSALGTFNTVCVLGTFAGTVVVEISQDGVDFAECMVFNNLGFQSKVFTAQFMRVRRKGIAAGVTPGLPNIDVGAINDPSGGGGIPVVGCWDVVGPFTAAGAPHALAFDQLAMADMSAGAFTFDLPAIGALNEGCQIVVKKIAGGGADIVLDAAGADTIEGAATLTVPGALIAVHLVSDGASNWMVI